MKQFFAHGLGFIKEFRKRKGGYIFISDILIKFNGLLLSFLIVRILTSKEYGDISYARSIIFPLTSFIGLGANHALLRFGAIQKSHIGKWQIFRYSLIKGSFGSLIMVIIIIALSSVVTRNLPGAKIYLCLLSFQLLSSHLNLTLRNLMRILKFNKLYGYSGIFQSSVIIILSIGLALLFKGNGYAIAIALTPLIVYLVYRRCFEGFPFGKVKLNSLINKKEFWRYGLFVGVGAIASQLLFNVGIIMIGNIVTDPEQVAIYKVATIIPFNLLFIPSSILKADYVYLAENFISSNKLINYLKKYWSIFSVLSLLVFVVFFINSKLMISLLFGASYTEAHYILRILVIGVIGAMMFRSLFGNILLAVGKANWNVINAFIIIILNIILNYFLIHRFGIIGAAYAMTISLWIGGVISGIMFMFYLKRFTK